MPILRYYLLNAFDEAKSLAILRSLQETCNKVEDLQTEKCFHIESAAVQTENSENILRWILKRPQDENGLSKLSQLKCDDRDSVLIEVGPRFNFSTALSTNSVSICQNVGLSDVNRVEVSVKYLLIVNGLLNDEEMENIFNILGDKMTECQYTKDNYPVNSFNERLPKIQEPWYTVPIITEGRSALEIVNKNLGLSFDDWDLDYYTNLFKNVLKRNPTSVELFDCAQSNSEHSRHWFFKGQMIIDGVVQEKSLIKMIIATQNYSNQNNTIKFSDNSSAIKGYKYKTLKPSNISGPGSMMVKEIESDLIFTAETHNMPTAVAPFSGATTGTGGRIRDVQGVGRGGNTIAGTAGYCVGNLNIPGYRLPYELTSPKDYPPSFASPLKIIIDASNGASDYGNKFGEPVVSGFAVSYGVVNNDQERDEYVKPIMFSGGLGTMNANQTNKIDPEKGMLLVKIGGPVYRIGVGGGAASSVEVQGDNSSELDFNAVQRGDAEMENKLNRVVRACIELGDDNPIQAIHDQGAGGNGNVLKELVEPGYAGAVIFSKEFQLGDPTITALELWGAEYQENNAILCKPEDRKLLEEICARERCPICFVGIVTGNGYVTLLESEADFEKYLNHEMIETTTKPPFDMHLEHVLGDMPQKKFNMIRIPQTLTPLQLLKKTSKDNYNEFVMRVLSLMTVGSKRFLTNKVDRSVTGLIAQQQCVGPLHTPLADYAVTAVSHFGHEGIATSIGTQPSKGLISASAGARMSVAEAISNLVFAKITSLADVKCSGNWMWAAKLPGEGAKIVDACQEMCRLMEELNVAIDGGKDSLSMAARVKDKTIKSPGTLVISTYAPCPDVRVKVTPDLKSPAAGKVGELVWVNIESKFRIGGSALAQVYAQQGNDSPNLHKGNILKAAFNVTQNLLEENLILSGHDISDGGLIVCLLEMAIAGICGLQVDISDVLNMLNVKDLSSSGLEPELLLLFAEECGWVLETTSENLNNVLNQFSDQNVPAYHIGQSIGFGLRSMVDVQANGKSLVKGDTLTFMKQWERTNFELEKLQMNRDCAIEEYSTYDYRTGPQYNCSFDADKCILMKQPSSRVRVAVIREEGINGDREMISTLWKAQFDVHDVTMQDLLSGKTTLDQYRGVIFPGGFSYADTLGSAKGWAASIMYSEQLAPQFLHFKNRPDTFSLGVCNGCQLMSLIGWVGVTETKEIVNVPDIELRENKSERYECRWVTTKVQSSKSIMLRRMAGTVIGVWIAHGEGRFTFKDDTIRSTLFNSNCVSLRYVDDEQKSTEIYPMNPNGSIDGIAGICSIDGRHLAMMPHPERCHEMWQWPYIPHGFEYKRSPWQTMFDEAHVWCLEN